MPQRKQSPKVEDLLDRIKTLEKRCRKRLGLIQCQAAGLEKYESDIEKLEEQILERENDIMDIDAIAKKGHALLAEADEKLATARSELESKANELDRVRAMLGTVTDERDEAKMQVELLSVHKSKIRVLATAICAIWEESGQASVALAQGLQKIEAQQRLPEWDATEPIIQQWTA